MDFRIVAATNRDLRRSSTRGASARTSTSGWPSSASSCRRCASGARTCPPLVEHFIARFYREEPAAAQRRACSDLAEALAALAAYPWPGNVRELRNVLFGALVGKRAGTELLLSDLPRRLLGAGDREDHGVVDPFALERALGSRRFNLRAEKERLERLALEQALRMARGNAARAAELLGAVGRGEASDPGGTVRAMMRRLGVHAARRPRRRSSRTR